MMKTITHTDFFQLAFGDGTPKKAFITAIVVGTILTPIHKKCTWIGEVDGAWNPWI